MSDFNKSCSSLGSLAVSAMNFSVEKGIHFFTNIKLFYLQSMQNLFRFFFSLVFLFLFFSFFFFFKCLGVLSTFEFKKNKTNPPPQKKPKNIHFLVASEVNGKWGAKLIKNLAKPKNRSFVWKNLQKKWGGGGYPPSSSDAYASWLHL